MNPLKIGFSNLLGANIDAGLKYFVTMGYHEDFATRTAFLKVIGNILIQGTDFDNQSEEGDKYDKLLAV
jgi:neurofibromin 1